MKLSEEFVKTFLKDLFEAEIKKIYVTEYGDSSFCLIDIDDNERFLIFDENEELFYENYSYRINFGATKIVFIFDDFDEVIKIPISGEYYDCEEGIEYKNYNQNYLALEKEIYDCVGDSIKQVLLNNTFLTLFGELPIYTQGKIKTTYRNNPSKTKLSKKFKQLKKDIGRYNLPADNFLMDILNFYKNGKEIIENIDFSDLNQNNYGYLFNNQPVIFDYGGYDS